METKTLKTIRVAIVEDDADFRETLQTFIERSGDMDVVAGYGSAEEALRDLPQARPDIVLMDIRLPNMSGIECVTRLRDRLPETKVVMLTAYEESEEIFQSLAAGAFGYLLKSTKPARLLESIREACQGGAPLSGSIARRLVDFFRKPDPAAVRPSEKVETALSAREAEILQALASGRAYKQIAGDLSVSVNTIQTHVRRIYEKLHVHNRVDAIRCLHKGLR